METAPFWGSACASLPGSLAFISFPVLVFISIYRHTVHSILTEEKKGEKNGNEVKQGEIKQVTGNERK